MTHFIKPVLALFIICIMLSGCGTLFGGHKYVARIIIKEHPNAEIYVGGAKIGKGTVIESFKRSKPLTIEVRQEGCEPKIQTFPNTFRVGSFILSIIVWGAEGMAIDLINGACYMPSTRDPQVTKLDTKNFMYHFDYSECPPD